MTGWRIGYCGRARRADPGDGEHPEPEHLQPDLDLAVPLMQEVIDRLKLKDDVDLGEYLINEAGVALVPGSAFGAPGYMRLSFATSMDNLKKGLQRITAALQA
jgi:aspartate/methionine/tyrosine aminotransferase